jgi:undecaprenyl diphosphate synthase
MGFQVQRDEGKLREYFAEAPTDISLGDIDLQRIPSHVSIIMDGNGRWAQARGLDRSEGHVAGVDSLRETVTTSVRLGLDVLSCYAFSTENWKRPQHEVDLLMHLFATTLLNELPLFHQENVRLRFFGDLEALPKETFDVFQEGLAETSGNTGMTFALAVNYGSRAEIARAARLVAEAVASGELAPDDVDEEAISSRLYTAGLPDPDLLIRTSGELRLSNYLLWQLAYTEFYATDTLWPDFSRWDMLRAIKSFQSRKRRFGGVVSK